MTDKTLAYFHPQKYLIHLQDDKSCEEREGGPFTSLVGGISRSAMKRGELRLLAMLRYRTKRKQGRLLKGEKQASYARRERVTEVTLGYPLTLA